MRHRLFTLAALLGGVLALTATAQAQYGPPIPPAGKGGKAVGGNSAGGAAPGSAADRPVMRLAETEYRWGKVMQGDPVTHVFRIHNDGGQLLRITNVKPGCGCTSKRFDREIPPGGVGEVELILNTKKLRGPRLRKYANIFTNDPVNAQGKVYLSGAVTALVEASPRSVRLTGLAGDPLTGEVTLKPSSEVDVSIESVLPQSQQKAASLKRRPEMASQLEITRLEQIDGTESYRVVLSAPANERPAVKRDQLVVTVKTPDGKTRETLIPVMIEHRDKITIQPRGNVVFNRRDTQRLLQDSAKPVRRDVNIFGGREDISFHVTGIELKDLPDGLIDAQLATIREGFRYKVSLTLNQYRKDVRTMRGRLLVHTDDPDMPTRELRVFAQFGTPTPNRPAARPVGRGAKPPIKRAPVRKGNVPVKKVGGNAKGNAANAGKGDSGTSPRKGPSKQLP